jgi:hydrogenase/urease accessory protein HupE
MTRALLLLLLLVALAPDAYGHEVRPAYLQLRQTGADTYDVLWKVPTRGDDMRLGLYVELPAGYVNLSEPRGVFAAGSFTERWSVKRAGGLTGGTIHIAGLAATMTDVLVRLARLDGTTQVVRLTPSAPSFAVEASPRRLDVARTYLVLGIEHILTGVDHLLFVTALLLLVSGFWRLVKTISAFTLSHSVTLSLATLGYVHVPPAPVEAVIALSILFVACEIVRNPQTPLSLAQRQPWLVAFTFGLLHGLGFAGGLSAVGLPAGHIPLALGLFSVGVEIGHFSFVGVVLAAIVAVRRWNITLPAWTRALPAYAIGSIAAFWVIQRIAAF